MNEYVNFPDPQLYLVGFVLNRSSSFSRQESPHHELMMQENQNLLATHQMPLMLSSHNNTNKTSTNAVDLLDQNLVMSTFSNTQGSRDTKML